jgi:hypothetical protein
MCVCSNRALVEPALAVSSLSTDALVCICKAGVRDRLAGDSGAGRRLRSARALAARAELGGSAGRDVGGCASYLGVSCEAVDQSAIE